MNASFHVSGTVTVKFGDDINTDYIIPAYILQEAWDKKFFADYAFERYSPEFVKTCRSNPNKDNVVVAGKNFGCGSSREQAVYAIQYNDVNAVIAESFPDIFFRNSINNSFCVVKVESVAEIALGDRVDIDLQKLIVNIVGPRGRLQKPILMNEEERDLLVSGGRLGKVKERLREKLVANS
jgi:3-isopropylmalate dehydratase small subunit